MKPNTFRLFNIFPTPYYGYYNKFNIEKQVFASDPMGNDSKTDAKKERYCFEHRLR